MNKFFDTALGGSRYVLMIGGLVFKFPYCKCIAQGREQNEKEWRDHHKSEHLAKLYFSFPWGWCNVAERVTPLAQPLSSIEGGELIKDYFKARVKSKDELDFLLVDGNLENFGIKDKKIVKLDWGGYGHSEDL